MSNEQEREMADELWNDSQPYCHARACAEADNDASGHSRNCTYGGGGDCNCPASEGDAFIVYIHIEAELCTLGVEYELEDGKVFARAMRAAHGAGVVLRKVRVHQQDLENIEHEIAYTLERLAACKYCGRESRLCFRVGECH